MEKLSRIMICVWAVLALVAATVPAGAGLVPTMVGVPAIVQSGTTSAFNQDTAFATDFETIDIQFPAYFDSLHPGASTLDLDAGAGALGIGAKVTANVLPFGPVNLAFPDIEQTVFQTQQVTHTDFAQTNELAAFTYPFADAGPLPLPGFGFGF